MSKNRTNKEFLQLKSVTPEEWHKRVMQVPQKCRTEVAHMVWWDYFSQRECLDRWPHLDEFLRRPKWNSPTENELQAGLIRCGYSPKRALQRVTNKMFNKNEA